MAITRVAMRTDISPKRHTDSVIFYRDKIIMYNNMVQQLDFSTGIFVVYHGLQMVICVLISYYY